MPKNKEMCRVVMTQIHVSNELGSDRLNENQLGETLSPARCKLTLNSGVWEYSDPERDFKSREN